MGATATLERMFWFDDQVRRGRYPNAAKLADRFELSPKTAQRCIDAMRDRFFAPLEYDAARRGYAYRDDAFELPHFQVTADEILAILLARKLLLSTSGGFISRDIECFSRKLVTIAGGRGLDRDRIDRLFSATWTGHAPVDAATFRRVSTGLLTSRCMTFDYCSPASAQITRRTVEPHHLQYYMASWVLTARCRLRNEWRKFYLSRMDRISVLRESFIPRPFDQWSHYIQGAFGIFQSAHTIDVVLRFTPFRAGWIREEIWHPSQTLTELDDGGVELRLPVADFREIRMKILQYGSDVIVVEPEALRAEIAREIERMGEVYQ